MIRHLMGTAYLNAYPATTAPEPMQRHSKFILMTGQQLSCNGVTQAWVNGKLVKETRP